MQVIRKYNNVSEELYKKCVPEFKDGEVVEFRLTNGHYDPSTKKTFYGASQSWYLQDRIKDVAGKALRGGDTYVRIGAPKLIENEEVKEPRLFTLTDPGGGVFLSSTFRLTWDGMENIETIEILLLSDHNGAKPDRDTSKPINYEFINRVGEAKESRKKTSRLTAALVTAENMGIDEVRSFAAGMNWNLTEDDEILREKVESYAKNHSDDFLKRQNDPQSKLKSILKGALDREIIKYVPEKHAIAWGDSGVTIYTLEREEGKSTVDLMADQIRVKKNGEDMQKAITNKYKATLREASVPE